MKWFICTGCIHCYANPVSLHNILFNWEKLQFVKNSVKILNILFSQDNFRIFYYRMLSINELILSSQSRFYFFSTALQLKIPAFKFNNRFVFHRTWVIYIQSILEFLDLIHDFLANGNIVRSSLYIFPIVSVWEVSPWPSE